MTDAAVVTCDPAAPLDVDLMSGPIRKAHQRPDGYGAPGSLNAPNSVLDLKTISPRAKKYLPIEKP